MCIIRENLLQVKNKRGYGICCLARDYNKVRRAEEIRGMSRTSSQGSQSSREFNSSIDEMGLFDILLLGQSFTWFGPRGTTISRLDRILVSFGWLYILPHSIVTVRVHSVLNHCLLVMKHFELINAWLSHCHFFFLICPIEIQQL